MRADYWRAFGTRVVSRIAGGRRPGTVPSVLVIAATDRELEGIAAAVDGASSAESARSRRRSSTAAALATRRPRAVLHVGLAGAHGFDGLSSCSGASRATATPTRRSCRPWHAPDATLARRGAGRLSRARVAAIGTSARVGGTTGCEVEAMEGFAVLRACALAGVPALEVRVPLERDRRARPRALALRRCARAPRRRAAAAVEALDA